MKQFIAVLSIVFFVFASAGLALADDPAESDVTSALDRHAVWTEWFDEEQEQTQSAATDSEDQKAEAMETDEGISMKVRIEDRPWARVG